MNLQDAILTYQNQLHFKKWALAQLKTAEDLFYFDYVTGVDAKDDKDIPGLTANETLTWSQALEVLKRHFA